MKRVLVVDDNLMDRLLLSRKITHEFKDTIVKEAKNGLEALSALSFSSYDLIITDVVMPKMEGLELIQQIKKHNYQTPIIAISGGNPYYLYLAKKSGVSEIFTKPIQEHAFVNKVSEYLKHNQSISA